MLGLGATAGCGGGGGSGDGTVTIRYSWWGAEERAKKINRTIALFEKKHPKTKEKTDFQTYRSFCKKFQTQASGGNPPDLFQNAVTFLRKYDKRGSPARSEVADRGGQLGIPVGSDTMALVIDEKVWRKAGVEPHAGCTWTTSSRP